MQRAFASLIIPSLGPVILNDYEVPECNPDVFTSYRHLSAWVIRQLIEAGRCDEDIEETVSFLEFADVTNLKAADSLEYFMENSQAG